jgi:glycosyltransferase involved in cell wall biosynthesis
MISKVIIISLYYDPFCHTGANKRLEEVAKNLSNIVEVELWVSSKVLLDTSVKLNLKCIKGIGYRKSILSRLTSWISICLKLENYKKNQNCVVISDLFPAIWSKSITTFQLVHDIRREQELVKITNWIRFFILKIGIFPAKRFITVSQFTKSKISTLFGVNQKDILVSYNGLSDEYYYQNYSNISRQNKQIIYVGDLDSRKNTYKILDIALELKNINFVFVISRVDPSQSTDIFFKKANDFNNVRICRSLTESELIQEYRSSDASISLSSYEGFGMTLLESAACGCHVFCSRLSPHVEVVDIAKINSYTFINLDESIQIISKKIVKILENKNREKAKVLNVDSFTWRSVSIKLLKDMEDYENQ